MDHRRLHLAALALIAVALAVAAQSNGIAGSDAFAQGITRSPVGYLPFIVRESQSLPPPSPTSTPAASAPADLVVTALAADKPQLPRDEYFTDIPIHLTMTVQNQGLGDAVGFAVHWLPEGLGGGPTVVISSGVRLVAGSSVSLAWDYTYFTPSPLDSTYQTVGIADPTNVISETDKTNNSRTLPLTVYWFM